MTSIFKLHDTVLKVSTEAKLIYPSIPVVRDESKLLSELVLCILSSQEKYEVALAAIRELKKEKVFDNPKPNIAIGVIKDKINNILQKPFEFEIDNKQYLRRLRFYSKKAQYIISTIENIYSNDLTIKKILLMGNCTNETRKTIISYSSGLGPKQASMFLRNIGYYTEYAVLDKHIIDYMRLMGLTTESKSSFSNIALYQQVEKKLKTFAESLNINLLHLDLAIWTTMRTLKYHHE